MNKKLFKEMCLTFLLILGMVVLFRRINAYLVQTMILIILYETKAKKIVEKALYYFSILTLEMCIYDIIIVLSSIERWSDVSIYTIWGTYLGRVIIFSEITYIISWFISKSIKRFAEKYPKKMEWYEKDTLKYVVKRSAQMFLTVLILGYGISMYIVGTMHTDRMLKSWCTLLIIGIIIVIRRNFLYFQCLGKKYYFSFPILYWIIIGPVSFWGLVDTFNVEPYFGGKNREASDFLYGILFNFFEFEIAPNMVLIYIGIGYIIGAVCYKIKLSVSKGKGLKVEDD